MLRRIRYFTFCFSSRFHSPANGIQVASEQTGTAEGSEAHLGQAGARSPTEVCLAPATQAMS